MLTAALNFLHPRASTQGTGPPSRASLSQTIMSRHGTPPWAPALGTRTARGSRCTAAVACRSHAVAPGLSRALSPGSHLPIIFYFPGISISLCSWHRPKHAKTRNLDTKHLDILFPNENVPEPYAREPDNVWMCLNRWPLLHPGACYIWDLGCVQQVPDLAHLQYQVLGIKR